MSKVTSRWYCVRSGYSTFILYEGDQVGFKYSSILEGWFDIFIENQYKGTIPENEFRMNFRLDNLLSET